MKRNKTTFFLISLLILISFAPIVYAESSAPSSHHIDSVPLTDQGDKPWCGPASLVMILQYWDVNITVNETGSVIDPEEDGCYTYELVRYLETFEFTVFEFNSMDDLKEWICKDHPIIVCQWTNELKQEGHFRVVTGYNYNFIFVHDPNGYTDVYTYEDFLELWSYYHNYGLTISPIKPFITDPYTNRTVSIGA